MAGKEQKWAGLMGGARESKGRGFSWLERRERKRGGREGGEGTEGKQKT